MTHALQPITNVLRNMAEDASQLYGHTKQVISKAIDHTPVRETTDKVTGLLDRHKDALFIGTNAVHAFLSPASFLIGMAAGATTKLAHRVGAIDLDPAIITQNNKVDYSALSALSMLAIHALLRGTVTGFITGAHLASGYQGAMPEVRVTVTTQ